MTYRELPLKLKFLIAAKGAAAVLAAGSILTHAGDVKWPALAVLVLLGAVGGACKVEANVPHGRITMGFTITYFAFLQFGAVAGLLVGLASTVAACVVQSQHGEVHFRPRALLSFRLLYNASNSILSLAVMAWIYTGLGARYGETDVIRLAIPSLASALGYYLVNGAGVTVIIAWIKNRDPNEVFRTYCGGAWTGFLTSASISVAAVWAFHEFRHAAIGLLFLPPAVMVYYSYLLHSEKMRKEVEHMKERDRLNEAIITSLAMAIDAKDHHTSKHTSRVREYAVALAQKLGVSPDELQAVRIASLLHDIGKIGIPESILCKPGKLTPEEFQIIQSHVEIGAAILEQIRFPWPVVPIVRGHHERWDGLGYPDRLKEEEIPVGARIISLVDVFDALTSERPYRKAMPRDQALKILQSGAGSQFDPQAVGAFLELLPELEALLQSMEEETAEALTTPPFLSAPVVDGSVEGPEVASVWEELERRLEERPALATFLPCLAELAPAAIPFSTLALLTEQGAARGNVAPTFTSGLWTSLVDGMEVALGEGVSGWVAHTGEPVRNAPASMDLGRRVRPGENLELNSTLSVPVTVGGRRAGALTLYHQSYNFYQAYHQERLVRLAGYVAQVLALEASRPVEEGQAERALPAEVSSAARLCPERIAGEGERSGERAAVALLPRVTPAHSELAANGASTNGCPRA